MQDKKKKLIFIAVFLTSIIVANLTFLSSIGIPIDICHRYGYSVSNDDVIGFARYLLRY